MEHRDFDVVIRNGILLTMSHNMDVIENPFIGVRGGRIEVIEQALPSLPFSYTARELIDASGCLIMPGLINTHTHLPMVCFRGMADDLPLMEWLHNYIWPAEMKYVNRDMVYVGSLLAMAEMLLSGTTTFCDAYFYESSVARASLDAGMRAVVCQGFIDLPKENTEDELSEVAERFIDRWHGTSPLLTPALACHAPYSCTAKTLKRVKEIGRSKGVLYTIHVSETREEVEMIKDRHGKLPFEYLKDLGVLDRNTIAIHCNWLEEKEIEILRECDVRVSHNPESSLKLAAGIAPIPLLLEKGVIVGLGTDGTASNNNLDLFGEMDMTAKIHKIARMDPSVMNAETVVKMATIEGAKVLGLEDHIGSLEVGKWADLILLDIEKPHWIPLFNPYSHLVYVASGADVMTVMIGGNIVMRERKLTTIDISSVSKEVKKIASRISRTWHS